MARQVEQETFDEIIEENMELFDLSREEAVADAMEQLRKTGISDFSNLILNKRSPGTNVGPRGGDGGSVAGNGVQDAVDHESGDPVARIEVLIAAVRRALDVVDGNDGIHFFDDVAITLRTLLEFLEKAPKLAAVAGARGAVAVTARTLRRAHDAGRQKHDAFITACCLLSRLCSSSDSDRARFSSLEDVDDVVDALRGGIRAVVDDVIVVGNEQMDEVPEVWRAAALAIIRAVAAVQRRFEGMKRRISQGDTPRLLLVLFRVAGRCVLRNGKRGSDGNSGCAVDDGTGSMPLFSAVCIVLRQLATPDDPSAQVSEAFVRARVLAGGKHVTESGLQPLCDGVGEDEVPTIIDEIARVSVDLTVDKISLPRVRECFLAECLAIICAVTVADEICEAAFVARLHEVCMVCLRDFGTRSDDIVTNALRVLRNMAGRDACKTPIYELMPEILRTAQVHISRNVKIAEAFCGLVAQLTLRRADIAAGLADCGVVDVIVSKVLTVHDAEVGVLKAGCLAVRNVCSRSEGARARVRENTQVVTVLRGIMETYGKNVDNAYYALREMDALKDKELRRDERYTMPTCFSH